MSDLFYVISVKHSHKRDRFITVWRPDNRGYCYRLTRDGAGTEYTGAGQYTREEVEAHLGYYNTGHSDIAVPVDVLHAMAIDVTPRDCLDGPAGGKAVLNTPKNWRVLIDSVIAPPKNKPRPEAIYFGKNRKV